MTAHSALTLHPGQYALKYKLCNWNQSGFSPVTIAIEKRDGQEVASTIYTPTVNIGGKKDNNFSGVNTQTFEFNITEMANYVVVFYTDAARNADFVLGQVSIQVKSFAETGIHSLTGCEPTNPSHIYDLSGRRLEAGQLKRGIYIIDGRKVVVQ